jgi:hypothetical protein
MSTSCSSASRRRPRLSSSKRHGGPLVQHCAPPRLQEDAAVRCNGVLQDHVCVCRRRVQREDSRLKSGLVARPFLLRFRRAPQNRIEPRDAHFFVQESFSSRVREYGFLKEVPRVGPPLHPGWLSTQRRGGMDARQTAGTVGVCLVGRRCDPSTDWGGAAALALSVRSRMGAL